WVPGFATHYGPFPSYPPGNDAGYQPLNVGVGCSNGDPGGDPRFNQILANGTYNNPLDPSCVWPKTPTVAVSAAAWQNTDICYQTLKIRPKGNPSGELVAHVVDWCPASGCLWPQNQLTTNVDLYGEVTWLALGGDNQGAMGQVPVEIQWPAGL
ncbi:hypothetical protein BDK51DRAFT_13864, partial [Blyttiomyces helicus]